MEQNNIEIWKPVVGYEGRYEVSNLGRVRSLDMRVATGFGMRVVRGRLRKLCPDSHGYLYVILYSEAGASSRRAVHRLVAAAFLPTPPDPSMPVNHINFVRDDNKPGNLEYVTPAQNVLHSCRAGRMDSYGIDRFSVKPEKLRLIRDAILEGAMNIDEIATAFNVTRSTVDRLIAGTIARRGAEPVRLVAPSPWEQKGRRRKLSPDDVGRILELGGSMSNPKIAEIFGVSTPMIWGILNGRYWKSMPTP